MNVIDTKNAPGAIGPYSQAFEVNGVIYTSGQIPVNPAGEWLPLWQKIAAVDYQYASRFDEMYEELMASPELTECRTYYSGIEAERMKFYSDIVSGYISGKECQESKCYYDIGNGFCEEDSETWPSMSGYKIQKSWLLENAKMMRFDP